jgi:hypothetical protein
MSAAAIKFKVVPVSNGIKRIPVADVERQKDEDRSCEVAMMRMLIRKYPEKARAYLVEIRK